MGRLVLFSAVILVGLVVRANADTAIASVQQKLKDEGFYYGEITGQKDADTTAAIRRYQIRNGLKITGDLNAETEKALGVKGSLPAPSAPPTQATAPRPSATPEPRAPEEENAPMRNSPGPRGLAPETSGIFDGTPYEVAPPELQRRVMTGAQTLLARRGYYRGAIDGAYGPEMTSAVRGFQASFGIAPNGRLDMDTLAALGLLPGQQAPGLTARPRHRATRRPAMIAPNGEAIYEPR